MAKSKTSASIASGVYAGANHLRHEIKRLRGEITGPAHPLEGLGPVQGDLAGLRCRVRWFRRWSWRLTAGSRGTIATPAWDSRLFAVIVGGCNIGWMRCAGRAGTASGSDSGAYAHSA